MTTDNKVNDTIRRAVEADRAWFANERAMLGHKSQQAFADAFTRSFRGHWAFDKTAEVWREWVWTYWREGNPTSAVSRYVTCLLDPNNAADHKAWLQVPQFKAIAELAQHSLGETFDANPSLIGLPDGYVLDTDTGEVVQSDWDSFIARRLPDTVIGDSDRPSSLWDAFVWESLEHYQLADRAEIKDYLQQWAGSALTGDCRDEAMLFLFGLARVAANRRLLKPCYRHSGHTAQV